LGPAPPRAGGVAIEGGVEGDTETLRALLAIVGRDGLDDEPARVLARCHTPGLAEFPLGLDAAPPDFVFLVRRFAAPLLSAVLAPRLLHALGIACPMARVRLCAKSGDENELAAEEETPVPL
jgi:hypothetical protein